MYEIFLDTSFAIALSSITDQHHAKAIKVATEITARSIIPVTQQLYDEAFFLFKTRSDKEWVIVDCISFTVMEHRGIQEALSADDHFTQAGFRKLL